MRAVERVLAIYDDEVDTQTRVQEYYIQGLGNISSLVEGSVDPRDDSKISCKCSFSKVKS